MSDTPGTDTTTFVIFGITGDLAARKLLPALFNLACLGRLPEDTKIVGFARRDRTDDEVRELLREGVSSVGGMEGHVAEWDEFVRGITYISGDLTNTGDYLKLDSHLRDLEGPGSSGRAYYLSVAPNLYDDCVRELGAAGMCAEDGDNWRRVVIEKPFGRDGASAAALDQEIQAVFAESQVYRIDHYVGKETVQNLMYFRFLNSIFEPLWNRNYIESVQISALEEVGVEGRVDFYDQTGVVRDMFQNHLLQVLAMVAMEPPNSVDADALRNEKAKVLQAVRCPEPEHAVSAQYEGYTSLPGVAPGSTTPTYAAMTLRIDNWRWQGVPFFLRSGKALSGKSTEVVIQFREPPHLLMGSGPNAESAKIEPNTLALRLQPNEGMHLRFMSKVPGGGTATRPVDMRFNYDDTFEGQSIPDAYVQLLDDVVRGDQSLFTRSDNIHAAWAIVDPLLEAWSASDAPPPALYRVGSDGPAQADTMLEAEGQMWRAG
ncbi:MAG: glucose-6-phosphate dehydrogenase [Chloroflexi bacterium]|jgi:glucose-6-phosphate 1-dehydrogenase|nr:glucose-6-phosphate dehydrogenase [Chloroflexota bacterium]MBT4514855.1 glucose-6-phosphate dehydrogenase [Chloroflexota bacterium]